MWTQLLHNEENEKNCFVAVCRSCVVLLKRCLNSHNEGDTDEKVHSSMY